MAFTRATAQLTEKLAGFTESLTEKSTGLTESLTEKLTGLTESLTEKHHLSSHAVRTRVGLVGAATLVATGMAGVVATPAVAAPEEGSRTYALGFVQAMAVGDMIADDVRSQARAQAEAQQRAADTARRAAEQPAAGKTAKADQARERAEDRRAERSAERRPASGYVAPFEGARTTTPYKASGTSWSSGTHSGIDFPVNTGTPISSVGPGTVVAAGWGGAYGNQVVVRHDDGRYTQYAHLSSLKVSPGQSVGAGDRIGLSGSTGNSTGPHLHFEARTGAGYGSDINPIAYLHSKGIGV